MHGEAHAEVVLDRLRDQGVKLHTIDVVTPLRETFAARQRATAGTSNSPAATGSMPSATSTWSRWTVAAGSNSSTKRWAG
ncbi:elongation factor G [Arthrobacter sp. Hiyo4]|nr:elongation factor G [Arthrobacter sp. Hiyo4]